MGKEPRVVRDLRGDVLILRISGDVTSAAAEELLSPFEERSSNIRKFILDFSGVEYINSSGIAVIIQILSKSRKNETVVLICGLTAHFQKVFEMVGLTRYTELFATCEEARNRLKQ